MSKIICDVCGTRYPESAEQCPICGRVRAAGARPAGGSAAAEDKPAARSKVKGGRFSEANVRKRNQNAPHYEVQQEKNRSKSKSRSNRTEEFGEEEPRDKSNTVINVLLVIVIFALLAVSAYIAIKFVVPNVLGADEVPETTVAPTETQPPATEETTIPTIPCTGLDLSETVVVLEAEGQMYLLNVVVTPEDTTDELYFLSDDESVVTVNEEGRITAVGEGDTIVTVSCGNVVMECAVVCTFGDATEAPTDAPTEGPTETPTEAPTEPLKDVKLSVKSTDVTFKLKGQQATFKLTCDLKNTEVQWISEDESIVTVDENGIATAVGRGTTNVVVKYGDQEIKIIVRCDL